MRNVSAMSFALMKQSKTVFASLTDVVDTVVESVEYFWEFSKKIQNDNSTTIRYRCYCKKSCDTVPLKAIAE
jgi:hypothetical protein